jgi:putative SOS response-associated peptidase YedK
MCGLVRVRSEGDLFATEIRVESDAQHYRSRDERPASDAKPSQQLLVYRLHLETGLPTEGMLRWGLIPHWMKARPEIQPINARAESVAQKRMFADAYAHHPNRDSHRDDAVDRCALEQ